MEANNSPQLEDTNDDSALGRAYAHARKAARRGVAIRVTGKVVGHVKDGVFHKSLRAKHFLKSPPGIALDVGSLYDAERAGATRILILDLDHKHTYRIDIGTFKAKAFLLDRGYGRQLCLTLDQWQRDDQPAPLVQLALV